MHTGPPMTIARLRALLDAYGADPARWPVEERAAACALIAESPEARRYRDAAETLDAVLDLAPVAQAPSALLERIVAAVPPRGEVAISSEGGRRNANARPRRVAPIVGAGSASRRSVAWRFIGGALPLAAAAALVVWFARGPEPLPESTGVAVAEIGVYDAPTDVLLIAPGMEALDSVPTFGCEESGLGCLAPDAADQRSDIGLETSV